MMVHVADAREGPWPFALLRRLGFTLALTLLTLGPAHAGPTGKVQGRILAAESGESIPYAEVVLLPADTTLRPIGGLANADGTYLLEVPPGRYSLQVRAMSYARGRVAGIVVEANRLVPVSTVLTLEAIRVRGVEVESTARRNTEASVLAARRRAAVLGDAVSAEQVRKAPDKDAAEVLRRVTGISVSEGKYVFVRGLGERYSSTEVDGVRIASPEQNRRVVPLDLLPASLLDNIVVQKTYSADRQGEFGGGDVQIKTRDFPGARSWSLSVTQGYVQNLTFGARRTYPGSRADLLGFGTDARKIPDEVYEVAGDRRLIWSEGNPALGFKKSALAAVARSFSNVWSPTSAHAIPNAGYSGTYGDEWRLFGRPLGLIESWNLTRSFNDVDESQRFFKAESDTLYDYAVRRSTTSVQLGGISGLSYRLSPSHTVHLRGLYSNSADDEVRTYEGPDHNRTEAISQTWLVYRNTRLMYVERNVLSGTLEGNHRFARLAGLGLDWRFSRSRAKRLQPDRRELTYNRVYYFPGDTAHWVLGSTGSREYGDLRDDGWGTTLSGALPYGLGRLGRGRIVLGYDRQTKSRHNFYRRFNLYPDTDVDKEAPPEAIFASGNFDGSSGTGWVEENTYAEDNYRAHQRVAATYLSVDVPLGARMRANLGVRVERGLQDVQSFDLFAPGVVTREGRLDNRDWLPAGNVTWGLTDAMNLRLAASRTLSRPDLNELSPSPALEYNGGMQVTGNPELRRAKIDNYDLRLEAFPGLSEVLAAGFFYKQLHEPIEQVIRGASSGTLLLQPANSDCGRNLGLELEARASLGRLWRHLDRLALNANASFISSRIRLKPQTSKLGTEEHPLQGQAGYVANAALSYATVSGSLDLTVLLGATGRRLHSLGIDPLPDVYEQPSANLDATLNWRPTRGPRVKFGARNLLDREVRQLQGDREISSYRTRRAFSIGLTFGS